ncbi:MAG: MFS transporter [Woeseia sp.]
MTGTTDDNAEIATGTQTSALSPFRHAIFRDVWFANLASQFGGLIQAVGAAWMMLSIAASAEMVTLVQASTTLPIVIFALVSGAFADSFDRRKIMIAAQVFMLVVSMVLAACAWYGLMTPWLLLLLTFLIGCGAAFNGPAWQASVAEMVPREDLPSAVALNSMGFNVARSVGPAIGGLIVAAAGAAAAFALNTVTYVGIIFVLGRWRRPVEQRMLPRERLGMAILAGIRYVAMSPNIKSTLLRGFVFGTGASALIALMPLIAKELIGGDSVTYGLLLGAFGAGAVGGALVAHRLRQSFSNETIVRFALLAFAAAAAATALSSRLSLTMAAQLLSGAGWVLVLATFNVTVQTSAPRWVVGRALSLYQMVIFAGMAGGSWISGIVTGEWGVPPTLLISVLVLLGCVALGWRFALPQTEELKLDLLKRWTEPEIALKIEQRSGPVVITIEYRIDEDDMLQFLAAMGDRKRIRRRDGARHWSLLRDLSEPDLWIERFQSPTWLDYVRQNQRTTLEDAVVWDRIRELHRGPDKPRVRRMIERQTSSLPAGTAPRARELADPLTDPARQA